MRLPSRYLVCLYLAASAGGWANAAPPPSAAPRASDPAIDFHLGFGATLPDGIPDRATSLPSSDLATRIGLGYVLPPSDGLLGRYHIRSHISIFHRTQSLQWSSTGSSSDSSSDAYSQWVFSQFVLQGAIYRPLVPRWSWLEVGLFFGPTWASELFVGNREKGYPVTDAWPGWRRWNAEGGAMLQARMYGLNLRARYSRPVLSMLPPSDLNLAEWGLDLLLPLAKRRVKK